MATHTAHPPRANIRLWLLALLGAAMLGILPLTLFSRDDASPSAPPLIDAGGARVAYLEFGATADTLWLAPPANPKARQKLGTIAHAPDFGAVAALSPARDRLAYTSLAPTMKPAPDAPADLWFVALAPGSEPLQLAAGVDLLVRPLWAPDGSSLVYRRSSGGSAFSLHLYDLASQTDRLLLNDGVALFPVAFAPGGDALYYVTVRTEASVLHQLDLDTGETAELAKLADTMTRDWVLSPAGDRLAYLEMSFDGGLVSSRGRVLDFESGVATAYTGAANAFGPVWRPDGSLTIGHDAVYDEHGGALVHQGADTLIAMPGPERGFDVPLGWSDESLLAVRSFEGQSAADPGRATLQVVAESGGRTTIATGEVTFLGWITP